MRLATAAPRSALVKIGFLGGSFDPVHFGHLGAAQDALAALALDRVELVPAAQAPLKQHAPHASAADRLAMLRLAVEDLPGLAVSDYEIARGGVNYTIESARHFRTVFPHASLFWIIGADQFAKLPEWREAASLACLVEFIVLERPGFSLGGPPDLPGLRWHCCPGRRLDLSSTALRARIRQGLALDDYMPHKAIVYLREKRLYLPAR